MPKVGTIGCGVVVKPAAEGLRKGERVIFSTKADAESDARTAR